MRYLRGLLAAAAVAGAGLLCVWAGHIGFGSVWRGIAATAVAVAAWAILTVAAPAIAVQGGAAAGWALLYPAIVLVVTLTWLTAIDLEVRTGRWQAVTVMDSRCQATDTGCSWQYRVSDAHTERDLGWITCDAKGVVVGGPNRLRVDPAGAHQPSLEPCAYTSPGWSTALRVVEVVWGLTMLLALIAAVVLRDGP